MAIIPQIDLFSWEKIEAASDIDRLALVLSVFPDEELMETLERHRGQGRDDYPIRAVWNSIIAGVIYGHSTIASLRRELRRNAELRQMCGFDVTAGADAVPTDSAFSRFMALLMENEQEIENIFHELVDELKKELPDLGSKLAVDSKAIRSYGRPVKDEDKKKDKDRRRDTDADWGVKTYKGKRKDGTLWKKTKNWFGYKLHLIVDSIYELPLAYEITKASANDGPHLLPLVEELKEHHPEIAENAEELSGDKGYDSEKNKKALYDEYNIKPVIDTRQFWKNENTRHLYPERADVFVYNEKGEVFCHCPSDRRDEQQVRQMAFVGFEKDRKTLKYRCPAAYYELECPGRAACEADAKVGPYGRVIRIPLDFDRRIFMPIAKCSYKWKKSYALRTSVERVHSRVDRLLGFERHTIRGREKMKTRMGLGLVIMLAPALGRIKTGQADLMRSMTLPIRRSA